VAPHVGAWRGPAKRIRVAFVSSLFRDHSVGRMYENVVRQLDRQVFEVILVHGPEAVRDAFSARMEAAADGVVVLQGDIASQHRAVAETRPDVMLFADIGMSIDTYYLGHARLAPVQVVVGGHPETTGLSTIDYFLSCDLVEPADGEAHYVERMVRLDRLPSFMEAPPPIAHLPSREAMGLPAGRLYGCPHTLFKFHPQFDDVLAGIAERDPTGWIVVPAADRVGWTRTLQARWAARHPALTERVIWLPRIPRDSFVAQLHHFDVLLDPLHFGSGQTLYLAMNAGTPLITCPGAFMRGRAVAGAYRQMGTGEQLVVADVADYAGRAVDLAQDVEGRTRLGEELRDAAHRELFSDGLVVRGLETFLQAAVEAAAEGGALPAGWRP